MTERKVLRSRQAPPNDPDVRREQRLSGVEATQEPWQTVQFPAGPTRIIYGLMNLGNASGTVPGMSWTRTSTGNATITLSPAFSSGQPAWLATPETYATTAQINTATLSSAHLYLYDTNTLASKNDIVYVMIMGLA